MKKLLMIKKTMLTSLFLITECGWSVEFADTSFDLPTITFDPTSIEDQNYYV